jgi:hypothetical protein
MAGPNQPEFLSDEEASAFASALLADQEPTDVDKDPTYDDGDQPAQTILSEAPNV